MKKSPASLLENGDCSSISEGEKSAKAGDEAHLFELSPLFKSFLAGNVETSRQLAATSNDLPVTPSFNEDNRRFPSNVLGSSQSIDSDVNSFSHLSHVAAAAVPAPSTVSSNTEYFCTV